MGKKMIKVEELKAGRFIVIDGEPCRIIHFSVFAIDKQGRANAKINAVGLFDAQKHSLIHPTSAKIEVPIIKRGSAQVMAIVVNKAQLMDSMTYEIFELPISVDLRGDVSEGGMVEYIQALGRRKIERVKE